MLSLLRIKDRLFYGWVVVIAFLVFTVIIYGTRYSFGVFFKPLESQFELTRAATSGVFSVYLLLCGVFSVLGGWALDRYGPRIVIIPMGLLTGLSLLLTSQASSAWQLFITYSLLLAMGTGAGYPIMMATISRWFDKKRGLAIGIASSGVGLGTLAMAPFATYLIINFDWRVAFIVMGAIAGLIITSLSTLLRKDPAEMGLLPDGEKPGSDKIGEQDNRADIQPPSLSLFQAVRTADFWFLGGIWFLWGAGLHLVLTHIVPHATDVGISAIEAAGVLSLIGGMNILGRLIMGWASDRIGRKTSAIICVLIDAGALIWLIWSKDLWMFYLFAAAFGLGYGGLTPSLFPLLGDIFGLRNLGVIMGVLDIGWAIGSAIGPALGGLVFDVTKSYFLAFVAGAVIMLVMAIIIAFLPGQEIKQE